MATPTAVLLLYLVLIVPAMFSGLIFAHKTTMTIITVINWLLILFFMSGTYRRDVLPQLPQNLGNPAVLIPTLHLVPGLVAQLLATYFVIFGRLKNRLPPWLVIQDPVRYMHLTLSLWLLTVVLGVLTWAVLNQGFLVTPAPASANGPGTPHVIRLVNGNRFDPAELAIATGTTITFENVDTRSHTVTSDDGQFASGELKPGASFSQFFGQPGDVAYYCDFHGGKGHVGMAGILHIIGSPVTVVPRATAKSTGSPLESTASLIPASITPVESRVITPTVTVDMKDDAFEPNDLTIAPGTVVHFVNKGQTEHTVTADDGSFDSDQIEPGGSFDHRFDKVGDVPLYCLNHGEKGGKDMAMMVHVKGSGTP